MTDDSDFTESPSFDEQWQLTINQSPFDVTNYLIFADMLEEDGRPPEKVRWVAGCLAHLIDFYGKEPSSMESFTAALCSICTNWWAYQYAVRLELEKLGIELPENFNPGKYGKPWVLIDDKWSPAEDTKTIRVRS